MNIKTIKKTAAALLLCTAGTSADVVAGGVITVGSLWMAGRQFDAQKLAQEQGISTTIGANGQLLCKLGNSMDYSAEACNQQGATAGQAAGLQGR